MSQELKRLEAELTEVVQTMVQCISVDDKYFKLIRRERQLRAAIYKHHEPEPETDSNGDPRLWSEKEIKVLRLHYKAEKSSFLESRLMRSKEGIRKKAAALGLQKFPRPAQKSKQ